jgi:hypothetical protein
MKRFAPITPENLPIALAKGEYERIYRQMSIHLRKNVSFQAFQRIAVRFRTGARKYKLQSNLPLPCSNRYVWIDAAGKKGIVAIFKKNLIITGIRFTPLTAYPESDSTFTKTTFTLPFHGTWFTWWGGMNELVNYHYRYVHQRYACDFLILKRGSAYSGNQYKNESYHSFGQEILAPAAGVVVSVENNIPDNVPVGKVNKVQPRGNCVIIDHGNSEFSCLAHLKQHSVRVKAGDEVKPGDVIGLCGNSGNSNPAHLHFQVSNSPDIKNSQSIRIRFQGDLEIIQGQFVTAP